MKIQALPKYAFAVTHNSHTESECFPEQTTVRVELRTVNTHHHHGHSTSRLVSKYQS